MSVPWHAEPADAVVAALASNARQGLTGVEAAARLERLGPNELPEAPTRSLLGVIAARFASPLIYLLLGAAGLALALGHWADGIVIAVVVLLNAAIGAFQEGRAERSMAALRKLTALRARVARDGRELVVAARELVPGDLLVVAAGDAVVADARLVEAIALRVSEAPLTGESVPVEKRLETCAAEPCSPTTTSRRSSPPWPRA